MSVGIRQQEAQKLNTAVQMTGASMLVEAFRRENVEVIFGYPGGAILSVYDVLYDCGIQHILTRHEQAAIHAAEGYARVTGRPGVVISTSGPGATNMVTGLADAMMDSLPLVVVTGQVATSMIGTDAFQEAAVMGITMPVTKHNYQVRNVENFPKILKEAFHIATTGRPGPVLIDLPKDISTAVGLFDYDQPVNIPGYQPTVVPNRLQVRKLVSALKSAKRPVILAGAGILHAKASEAFARFVERVEMPVVNTLLGLGSLREDHPMFLGMAGMHGNYAANRAIYECDLLLNIGARFDDRLTGNVAHFAKDATVVHIDIDPAEIGKNIETDIPVVGDAKAVLSMLMDEGVESGDIESWRKHALDLRVQYPYWYVRDGVTLKPQRLMEIIYEATAGRAIVVTDVGQHQMWAAQYYRFTQPNRWVTSGGLGTMGFGLPAAIGAQLADRNATVVAILGDGGFQMNLQELVILAEYGLPVKVVIVNNQSLGMVRQWQQLIFKERYSESLLPVQPDYLKLAEAYRIQGFVVDSEEEAEQAFKAALQIDGPVLLDCRVTPSENVYPMITPGCGIQEMVGVKP